MEIQKFRILRPLTYDANGNVITNARDVNWTIPCSGATDLWPLNVSVNCSGTTIYDANNSDIWNWIRLNSKFPEKLKDCSVSNPGVIVDDLSLATNQNHCSNIGGYKYVLFKGLKLMYNDGTGNQQLFGSYNELSSIIDGFHTGTTTAIEANTIACTCMNTLGPYLNQVSLFLSQDYNDIGHYDVWDGNIGQQDTFGNFILSASTNQQTVTMFKTTDVEYHNGVKDSVFSIDWGDGTVDSNVTALQYQLNNYQWTHTYLNTQQKQYKITVIQDTPWGSKSVSNIITIPNASYPVMFSTAYSASTVINNSLVYGSAPGSGMTSQQTMLTGLPTFDPPGASNAYHTTYPDFPLDSATDFDQFSGMTFGPDSVHGKPCYTVTGITDSILGNFQTYTTASTVNLPPGYVQGVLVPIGGDVLSPLTNTFQTGIYGMILTATPTYTAYTMSSSYGASGGFANGDTPINFYDFSNGVTIFEAESCGLDNRSFGAEACIDCPEDNCDWCQHKDEYIDRVTKITKPIPTSTGGGLNWSSVSQYSIGDIVYDVSWDACCCFICVEPVLFADSWFGISPSSMMEGVWNGVHIWEACSDDCVSCPIGTKSPCNDASIIHGHQEPNGKASYYSAGTNYNINEYIKGGNGNCYKALNSGALVNPTGTTGNNDWNYVGCVSWECPTGVNDTECIMISGSTPTSTLNYMECQNTLNNDECFPLRWACIVDGNGIAYQCNGCEEIDTSDVRYTNVNLSFANQPTCAVTCSPPAYSCTTDPGIGCCATYDCSSTYNISQYIANVYPVAVTYLGIKSSMATNEELWVEGAPTNYTITNCEAPCCVLTSWVWNCEEGCVEQLNLGGFLSFDDCKIDSKINVSLNPNIGVIDPLDPMGNTYGFNSSGLAGQIPCGWECIDSNEMYPLDADGNYSSPCDPCFIFGCGLPSGGVEVDCVTVCSASTSCYVCDCTSLSNCAQFLDCPTFIWDAINGHSVSEHGPNEGVIGSNDNGLKTYNSQADCGTNCGCSGYDCVVYKPGLPPDGHINYDPNDPQKSVGLGCQSYTELQLASALYTWSNNNVTAPYADFESCCAGHPDCCNVGCDHTYNGVTASYVDPNDPNVPCMYWPANLTPMPSMFYPSSSYPLTPMAKCLGDVVVLPSGVVACDTFVECTCACNTTTVPYIENTLFGGLNSIIGLPMPISNYPYSASTYMDFFDPSNPIFTGLTLSHFGPWAFIPPPNNTNPNNPDPGFYDAGVTVTHDVVNTYFSTPCCYVCACIAGFGNPLTGSVDLDCDDFQPGVGPHQGQANCWVNCNKQASDSLQGMPCPDCSTSPDTTWRCTANGCEVSTCNYAPVGLSPSYNAGDWQRDNNCYSASTCWGECRAACSCDSGTTTNVCVMLQDVVMGNIVSVYGPDVVIPINYSYWSLNGCDSVSNLPGIDCCTTTGPDVTYGCDSSLDCIQTQGTTVGDGIGCYQILPGQVGWPGQFHDGNLTGANGITYLDALSHCEAYCTWECNNNTGCDFQQYSTSVTLNTAYDCFVQYGSCTDCGEKWFCLSSQTSSPCVTETYMLSASETQKHQALGLGMVAYSSSTNMDNVGDAGFISITDCEEHCRFCCDPDNCVTNILTSCSLSWNDPFCFDSIDQCLIQPPTGTDGNCCWDEWYCENDQVGNGCMGYDLGSGVVPPAGSSGPYSSYLDCTEFCGYVCGDNFDIACMCRFHNEDSNYQVGGNDIPLHVGGVWEPDAYPNNATCMQTSSALQSPLGGVGCCDCYDCYFNGQVFWSKYFWGSYIPGPISTVLIVDTPDATAWQINGFYSTGQAISYESPLGEDCCYIFIGNSGTGGGSGHNAGTNTPYEWWSTYMADVALGTGGNWTAQGPTTFGLDDPDGLSTNNNPTLWRPCDMNCPGAGIL